MKFLDSAKIYLKSGHGGAGACSFRREKFIEFGGPDGGNGGRGGDIVAVADPNSNTLVDFRFKQHFKAGRGGHGMGRNRSGKAGQTIEIAVPVGTQILSEDGETLITDMLEPGERVVLLSGGDGGFGNAHYKSSTNRAPRRFDEGYPGQDMWVWLKLKLLADAGLVGFPNAGKSTLLSALSNARPKIADYPFTTLNPLLGVVERDETRFVVADIPGLIEGAHEGIGLGHQFLAHIERCAVLAHLIDVTADDPLDNYRLIRRELTAYGHGLEDKPEIICLNKTDALPEELWQEIADLLENETGKSVMAISAVSGAGLKKLINQLSNTITQARAQDGQDD